MGIRRGTKLALVGVFGATLAWWFRVGERLRQYEFVESILDFPVISRIIAEYGAVLDWSVGVVVGVVVADVVGYLGARNTDRDVKLSSTLGVGKGVVAVAAGVLALVNHDVVFAELTRRAPDVAEFVRNYLGATAFCFAVGVWAGAVVGEVARL